jgi:hypothetical protein
MRTWPTLIFSSALIVIGAAPVLYLLVLALAQLFTSIKAGAWVALPLTVLFTEPAVLQAGKAAPLAGLIPNLSAAWVAGPDSPVALVWLLNKVHVALLPALLGAPLLVAGVLKMRNRRVAIQVQKERHEDRLRRVRDYQHDDTVGDALGRREPFISSRPAAQVPRRAGAQG